MYNDQLQAKLVSVDSLFLDPNNPRFFEKNRKVAIQKYTDPKIQEEALRSIKEYNVDDLVNSIMTNGFLPMDRIVVKRINETEQYYALEGNRRLASVKIIKERLSKDDYETTEQYDSSYYERLNESLSEIEVLVYEGDEDNIAWMLQGIRHISGIKEWSPTQRAKLVSELIESQGKTFSIVGKQFGLSAISVGRLYRGYKGLQQMKNDDEYASKAQNDFFTLFEEAHKNKNVRTWLGWDDDTFTYNNVDNFKQYCSWISKDEDQESKGEKSRRIHDSRHVRMLDDLISKKREDLISQIDYFELTIEQAASRAEETKQYDWKSELERAFISIKSIPATSLLSSGNEIKSKLSEIKQEIDILLSMRQG